MTANNQIEDLSDLSSWGIRLNMAKQGWHSKTRLQRTRHHDDSDPNYTFQVWMSRSDWHGHRSGGVTFHTGVTLDPSDKNSSEKITDTIRWAAELSLRAWREFTDSIPHMGGSHDMNSGISPDEYKIVEHTRETEHIFKNNSGRGSYIHPTEKLPDDISTLCDFSKNPSMGDTTAISILKFAKIGFDYTDDLTTFGRNLYKYDDYKDRKWGLDYNIYATKWHGIKTAYQPLEFSIESLAESVVSMNLDAAYMAMKRLLTLYSPEGEMKAATSNGLPPGMMTTDEYFNDQDIKQLDTMVSGFLVPSVLKDSWDESEAQCILETWKYKWEENSRLQSVLPEPTMEWLKDYVEKLAEKTSPPKDDTNSASLSFRR